MSASSPLRSKRVNAAKSASTSRATSGAEKRAARSANKRSASKDDAAARAERASRRRDERDIGDGGCDEGHGSKETVDEKEDEVAAANFKLEAVLGIHGTEPPVSGSRQ